MRFPSRGGGRMTPYLIPSRLVRPIAKIATATVPPPIHSFPQGPTPRLGHFKLFTLNTSDATSNSTTTASESAAGTPAPHLPTPVASSITATQTSGQSGPSAFSIPRPLSRPSSVATVTTDSANNVITLHYNQSSPIPMPPPTPPPPPQPSSPLVPLAPAPLSQIQSHPSATPVPMAPPAPSTSTYVGLSTTVREGSFSDRLTNSLEANYMTNRLAVMSQHGDLITPLQFLKNMCDDLQLGLHLEIFKFSSVSGARGGLKHHQPVQFRAEIYAGLFCGVGHALSQGYSGQLAAAHVLERMRVHVPAIKQSMYALYPGNRYTKIGYKLESLCEDFRLGEVKMDIKKYGGGGGGRGRGGGGGRGGGRWERVSEVKWEIKCFVGRQVATVCSDDQMYGSFLAKTKMFLNFVQGTEEQEGPVVQVKDYFAVGVDCPMLKDIHPSVLLCRPSNTKLAWMEEFGVDPGQMDQLLNDPLNNSGYLFGAGLVGVREELEELKRRVGEFLVGMGRAREENNRLVENRGLPQRNGGGGFGGEGGGMMGGGGVGGRGGAMMGVRRRVIHVGRDGRAFDNGNDEDDQDDQEVGEIFHDARMEMD